MQARSDAARPYPAVITACATAALCACAGRGTPPVPPDIQAAFPAGAAAACPAVADAPAHPSAQPDGTGPPWLKAFSAWVEAHKFYPSSAAAAGEEGESGVKILVERDGRVRNVCISRSSGHTLLDLSLVSLFRNKELPPFPAGATRDYIVINMTMQFRLTDEPRASTQ